MENFYKARNSIYCYPGTDILINKLNIHDSNKLFKLEKQIVLAKSYILRQNAKKYVFDKKHFVEIHHFLFGDIYNFAGKFRTENIAKDDFTFASWEYIEDELDRLMSELEKENYLKNLDQESLAKRLAYYLSELNVLHPFREGNGRTIREFIRELAYSNNYVLDLRKSSAKDFFEASVKSVYDTSNLEKIIFKCLIPIENKIN